MDPVLVDEAYMKTVLLLHLNYSMHAVTPTEPYLKGSVHVSIVVNLDQLKTAPHPRYASNALPFVLIECHLIVPVRTFR